MKIGSQILWLSETDVAALLSMPEAIQAMENAFRLHGQGRVQLPAKIYLEFKPWDGDLRAMPAYVQGETPSAGVWYDCRGDGYAVLSRRRDSLR